MADTPVAALTAAGTLAAVTALAAPRRAAGAAGAGAPGEVLVLSPHPDDAVLSCGALLTALLDPRAALPVRVTVLTVFTEAGPPPYTLSARRFLRLCGAVDAAELYAERRAEDRAVLGRLGVARFHAGFVDGLFRRDPAPGAVRRRAARLVPELGQIYPTYRLHLVRGGISPRDAGTLRLVTHTVRDLLAPGRGVLFAPLGVGGHADHLLVRTAAELTGLPVLYYSDFPYNTRTGTAIGAGAGASAGAGAREGRFDDRLDAKAELLRGYRTQFPGLFPDGTVPLVPEVYALPAGAALPRRAASPAPGGAS
ncbi:PIG-L deacetylase family protein [Streptomyces sp. NPDC090025]|uniref:PIG-L deacetylase family protein n=1 Tax=Streptomyces sp. NPDC090025 TaxID=3365922 RepID=UPI003832F9F1